MSLVSWALKECQQTCKMKWDGLAQNYHNRRSPTASWWTWTLRNAPHCSLALHALCAPQASSLPLTASPAEGCALVNINQQYSPQAPNLGFSPLLLIFVSGFFQPLLLVVHWQELRHLHRLSTTKKQSWLIMYAVGRLATIANDAKIEEYTRRQLPNIKARAPRLKPPLLHQPPSPTSICTTAYCLHFLLRL